MDLSHARSLIPAHVQTHVEEHRPLRDEAMLQRLAGWALRYSPTVAPDPPDGLLLDATGMERLYRSEVKAGSSAAVDLQGERALSRALGEALVRRGFAVRIAVAGTFAAARALARCAPDCITHVAPGRDREALAPLPMAALGLDGPLLTACDEIGLTKIGHLFDLPRAALASQFGEELLRRVDRALGLAPELIEPVHPEPPPRAELLFEGPSDRWDALAGAAREVLDRLSAVLDARCLGVRDLELEVLRPSGLAAERRRVQLSRPSASRRHLWAMLRPVLECVDLTAGVEGVALTALDVGRRRARQAALGAGRRAEADDAEWGEIVDTLVLRLGAENVLRFEPLESHLPERAFRPRPATEAATSRAITAAVTSADRPTRLFAPSRPARVILRAPDGPILQVAWEGGRQNVVASRGPERIGAEWWRALPATTPSAGTSDRDYFRVQTEEGAWLWVGRCVDTGQWFVHGDWA